MTHSEGKSETATKPFTCTNVDLRDRKSHTKASLHVLIKLVAYHSGFCQSFWDQIKSLRDPQFASSLVQFLITCTILYIIFPNSDRKNQEIKIT